MKMVSPMMPLGGPDPVLLLPREMREDELQGLVQALNRYIKKGLANLAGFVDLRSQLRAAARSAV